MLLYFVIDDLNVLGVFTSHQLAIEAKILCQNLYNELNNNIINLEIIEEKFSTKIYDNPQTIYILLKSYNNDTIRKLEGIYDDTQNLYYAFRKNNRNLLCHILQINELHYKPITKSFNQLFH